MKIRSVIVLVTILFILSVFASCSQNEPNPEEFGIDSFINGHALYVLGAIEDDHEFVKFAGDCVAESFCTCNLPGAFFKVEGSETVKWQINKVITRSGYEKDLDSFLYPTPLDGNYPVFFVYTLDVDGERSDYLLRVTQYKEFDNDWKVELVMIPTVLQLDRVTSTLPDNPWHTVTKDMYL